MKTLVTSVDRILKVSSPQRCHFLHLLTLHPQLGELGDCADDCPDFFCRIFPRTTNATPVRRHAPLRFYSLRFPLSQ
jgi:hypothetical protein